MPCIVELHFTALKQYGLLGFSYLYQGRKENTSFFFYSLLCTSTSLSNFNRDILQRLANVIYCNITFSNAKINEQSTGHRYVLSFGFKSQNIFPN